MAESRQPKVLREVFWDSLFPLGAERQSDVCLSATASTAVFPQGSWLQGGFDLSKTQISLHFLWSTFLLSPQILRHCLYFAPTINRHRLLFTFFLHFWAKFYSKNVLIYHPFQLNNRSGFPFPFLLSQHSIYHNCLLNKWLNSFLTWTCSIQNSHGKLNPNVIILRVGSSAERRYPWPYQTAERRELRALCSPPCVDTARQPQQTPSASLFVHLSLQITRNKFVSFTKYPGSGNVLQ